MGDGFEYISKKLFLVTVCAELCSLSLVAALAAIGPECVKTQRRSVDR